MPVNISINTNTVAVQENINHISVNDPNNPNIVDITQPITQIVEIITSGPKGDPGPILNTGSFATTGSNIFIGNQTITGSLTVTQGITGSLFGTSSYANQALSSSYASTASYAPLYTPTSSFNEFTQSYNTGSFTGSFIGRATGSFTGSLFGTASYATNALTASFATSASYVNPLNQNVSISGSLRLDPTQDPDPLGLDLDSTSLFQSSSNTALGYDLYVRQNGNLVKWKWVEGNLETGLLYGGVVTYSGSNVFVSSGSGIIAEHNATTGSEISPIINYVTWNAITQSVTNIATQQVTYLYIDQDGNLQQQSTRFTAQEYHNYIPLGAVGHFDYTQVSAFGGAVQTAYDQISQTSNFIDAFGPLKVSGYGLTGQTNSLRLSVGSGTSFIHGGFYQNDPEFPSQITTPSQTTASLARVQRSGSVIEFDTNAGNFYTVVNPTQYDRDGDGILHSVGSGNWSIQRVFSDPKTGVLYVYYGQERYTSLLNALQYLPTDPFTEGDTFDFTTFIGFLVLKGNASDITDTANNRILSAGLFRGSGQGSGGGIALSNLDDLTDVSITSPINGQALIYDAGIWVNGTPLNATSASRAVSSSFATTASFATQALSSSYALTASYALNGAAFPFTGSAQITGSLEVKGPTQLSGSLSVSGSISANAATGSSQVVIKSQLDAKQDVLVSGTNIKTINGTSLLGSGDIAIVGDMVLADAQTVSGIKTFLAGKLGLRNVANTFTSFFTNSNTAARTYTLQNRDGTLADNTDLAGKMANPTGGIVSYLPKFLTATTMGLSRLWDTGTYFGIGTVNTPSKDITLGNQADREIGVELSDSITVGRDLIVTAGKTINYNLSNNFVTLSQTVQAYRKAGVATNGDFYISSGLTLYKQPLGSGNLVLHYTSPYSIYSTAVDSSGNVYIATTNGIYKQIAGAGSFVLEIGITTRSYYSMAFHPDGHLYAVTAAIDNFGSIDYIYKRINNTGDFVAVIGSTARYNDIACAPNGDVYASQWGTGIIKQASGSSIWSTVLSNGTMGTVCVLSNGTIYAANVYGGVIPYFYISINNGSTFTTSSISLPVTYTYLVANGNNVYAYEFFGSNIFIQNNNALGTSNLDGGTLKVKAGTGKGTGKSRYEIYTGQKTVSGTDMQLETKRLEIDEDGNVMLMTSKVFADNAAAIAGGLPLKTIYWTVTGEMRMVV